MYFTDSIVNNKRFYTNNVFYWQYCK